MLASIRASLWRLINLFRTHKSDSSLDQELAFHLDMEIEGNLRQGMSQDEARRRAHIALGGLNQTKEEYRSTRGIRWLEELWQDLRYAQRVLTRSPGFTIVVISVLALGIGANTAVVSIIDAVVFRPLPVSRPDQLAKIVGPVSYPDYLEIKSDDQIFSGIVAYGLPLELKNDQHPEGFSGHCVSANFFQVLGLGMALGRGFLPGEDAFPPTHSVAVISYRSWERDFGADPAILGKTVKANGEVLTIVGVAPKGFRDLGYLGAYRDVWIPFSLFPRVQHLEQDPNWHDVLEAREKRWLTVIGRLKPGVTMEQANAHVRVISGRLKKDYPETNRDWDASLASFSNPRIPWQKTQFSLAILLAAATCIFLIACTNVASLMLGRASARQREIATRLALGAGRPRIVRQLLTEGMVLSFLALAASLAVWGLTLRCLSVIDIEGARSPASAYYLPDDLELAIDHRVLIIALAVTLLTNLIFALAPCLVGSRPELTSSLKNQGFLFVGRAGSRWRRIPIVIQIALSSILLVGAGLFTRTIVHFKSVDPGFDQKVMILDVGKPFYGFDVARSISYYRQVLERLQAVPGISSASFATDVPPERGAQGARMRAEQSLGGDAKWHWFYCNAVTPEYFKTLRMPIIQGRDFTDRDNEKSADVVIVNETLARRYWPAMNALGERMQVPGSEGKHRSFEIVGIVADAKYSAAWKGAKPYLYFPLFQSYSDAKLQISVIGSPSSVVSQIRQLLEPLGPDVRVIQARTMSAEMDSMLDRERSIALVFGIFGSIALILAGIGLYGVIAYFITQRTREFGIRMALGARPADIIRQIICEGMALVVVGLGIGLPCSLALSRFISSQLHGVSTADPLTYVTISLLCLGAALMAVVLPARRATANCMEALRFE